MPFRTVPNMLSSGDLERSNHFRFEDFDLSGSPEVIGDVTNLFFT